MNQGTKIILGIIAAIVLIWIGFAVGKSDVENNDGAQISDSGDTYRIGAMTVLTGDAAVYGEPARNIFLMAADEINAAGGINGKDLEIIIEDAGCNGTDGTNAIQKLINIDKVGIVIGGFCSSESLAAAPIAEQHGVLLLSPGSSSPDLTGISPYFFRNYPSDATQGEVLAQVAYDRGWRKVAVMQEQTDYALGLKEAFEGSFIDLGGSVVAESFATQVNDFRTQIAKLQGENTDALLVSVQTPAVAERVLQQAKDLGWNVPLMGADVIPGSDLPQTKPALVEGMIVAQFGYDAEGDAFKSFAANYQAAYGEEVPFKSYAQTEYDAVYLLADAIAAVGDDPDAVAQWLRDLEGWEGVSGVTEFADSGDRAVGGHQPEIIEDGVVKSL